MQNGVAHQYLRRRKNSQQVEVIGLEFIFHKYNQLNGAALEACGSLLTLVMYLQGMRSPVGSAGDFCAQDDFTLSRDNCSENVTRLLSFTARPLQHRNEVNRADRP